LDLLLIYKSVCLQVISAAAAYDVITAQQYPLITRYIYQSAMKYGLQSSAVCQWSPFIVARLPQLTDQVRISIHAMDNSPSNQRSGLGDLAKTAVLSLIIIPSNDYSDNSAELLVYLTGLLSMIAGRPYMRDCLKWNGSMFCSELVDAIVESEASGLSAPNNLVQILCAHGTTVIDYFDAKIISLSSMEHSLN
jgi:hypothetical protein